MKITKTYLAVAMSCACGAATITHADVLGAYLELESPNVYNLYAAMSADTIVFNADLGDTTIDLPPAGVNNGLFSEQGAILFSGDPFASTSPDSWLSIGDVSSPGSLQFGRPMSVDPFGTGSMADAAWFVIDGVAAEFRPNQWSDYALQLGHFVVEDGALLGGFAGGLPSRIYIGWEDDDGVAEFGVFNIPTPAALSLLLCSAFCSRRRRRMR